MSKSMGNNPDKAAGTKSNQPQTETKLDSQVEQEKQSMTQVKAEGNAVVLSQSSIQNEVKEQLKANYEAWQEDSSDTTARDQFNSQATSIGKMAGLQGTRPRLSESGDKLEFDA